MYEKLKELMQKYASMGFIMGGELALPREYALSLADDLRELGIVIMGLDGWKQHPGGNLMQDLATDYTIPEIIYTQSDAVYRTVELIKQYIETKIPEDVAFVSFSLHIPVEWDIFSSRQ